MKGVFLLTMALTLSLAVPAQQTKKTRQANKTSQVRTSDRNTQTRKKAAGKTNSKKTGKKKPVYTNAEIKGLQSQKSQIQSNIKEKQKQLQANRADVKKRVEQLMVINGEINAAKKTIEGYQTDIKQLDNNIGLLRNQKATLEEQLEEKKQQFMKSMRYMAKKRNLQETMMFVFSAKNLSQAYRRMRFIKGYAAHVRSQAEQIRQEQQRIQEKDNQLQVLRQGKNQLMYKSRQEQASLESKQNEQQEMVKSLQNQQKAITAFIAEQQKKQADINAQIDRLIAIEIEKARQRAAEEARRKAAAAAAAKKKREEERARQRAAALARERENRRRIEEARRLEAKRRSEAAQAAKQDEEKRRRAAQALREAEAERAAAERKADADKRRNELAEERAKKADRDIGSMSSTDRELSGRFENNRGRLAFPVAGSYRIVSHFGQYNVEGLKNVYLDNKGINIMASPGATVRSVFAGEVSAVFGHTGTIVVMVRHGSYISVYCNLNSVSVRRGQQVAARQALGTLGGNSILQFQLRHETRKLNPEVWLGR